MDTLEQLQVTFNGNRIDLADGVTLYNYDFTSLPEREINIHKLARRSLSIITSSEYSQKTIPLWLDICAGDRQDTEAAVTSLKALLQAQNGQLRVLQGGIEVTYTATMNEFNIEWNAYNAYVQIVFIASTPIGTAVNEQVLLSANAITTQSYNQTFIVEGSFAAEPVITVVINSVTGGTGQSISLFNAINNQGITVTGNYSNGSILVVDSYNMTVTLDGAALDFTGLFPQYSPGSNQIGYNDTFTTRSVDITATYQQRLI